MTTIAGLLYPKAKSPACELQKALRPVLKAASLASPAVSGRIAEAILAFFDEPLGNLALTAYQKHRLIAKAKTETADQPGSRQVVELLGDTVNARLEPIVEVEVNGVSTPVLRVELEAKISIQALTAVVQAGQLVELKPGQAAAEATLSAGGRELAKAKSRPIDLSTPTTSTVIVDLRTIGEPIIVSPGVADDVALT